MDNSNYPSAIIIFLMTIFFSIYTLYINKKALSKFALRPWSIVYEKKWYTIITSGFIHANLVHLMFNMITFVFFAPMLEGKIGSFKFLIIYFGSMILSDITTILKNKDNYDYVSVGASGAISGILFSFILFFPKTSLMILFLPIPIPAPIFAIIYLLYSYFSAKYSKDLINHEAHFWGAIAGIVLTVILIPESLESFFKQIL